MLGHGGVALLAARVLLAGVLAGAGTAKLADLEGAREAARAFGAPAGAARVTAVSLPVAELALATGLIVSASAWWAALGALALLALLTAVVARSLVRGEMPDCHCFGRLHSGRVGRGTLARNLLLAAVAAAVVAHGRADAGASATRWITDLHGSGLVALTAALVLTAVILAAAWLATELLRRNGRQLLRVQQLEQTLAQLGIEIPPPAAPVAGDPDAAVRPGEPAPGFALPDLDGKPVTLADLLAPGRGAVLVFASPTCHPCRVLLRWLADRRTGPEPVVIGEGDAQSWRALPPELAPATLLLQNAREVAARYGADVTPAAVRISPDGSIAAPPAFGASAVRDLLGSAPQPAAPLAPERVQPALRPLPVREGALT